MEFMAHNKAVTSALDFTDAFSSRHIGPREDQKAEMLRFLGFSSMDELTGATVPNRIRAVRPLGFEKTGLPDANHARTEAEAIEDVRALGRKNGLRRSYIGAGFYGTVTPPVILRNILENPGWYTQYTPYQAEIAQGRLEALLNFQTMVASLTGLEVANASMLDDATAAAEAMNMCFSVKGRQKGSAFFISEKCFPHTIAVVKTRAEAIGVDVMVGNHETFRFDRPAFGVLVQYPGVDGVVNDFSAFFEKAHQAGALAAVAADPLALALYKTPGEMGADAAVGSMQRFGLPMGFGGPHAGYFAVKDAYKRQMPGRIVGVSKDSDGKPAIRLALQTREQHIRREKATSNICTAQVLTAVASGMYAVYHGPEGLRRIAARVHLLAGLLVEGLRRAGFGDAGEVPFFDTVFVKMNASRSDEVMRAAAARGINLRRADQETISVSLDETVSEKDLQDVLEVFCAGKKAAEVSGLAAPRPSYADARFARKASLLSHEIFNSHHSETGFVRYVTRLQSRDLSLINSMTPLGSCTMKLNAAAQMMPVTWPEFTALHPYAPLEQAAGFMELVRRVELMLAEITGFDAVTLQPNAGSQGEYTGLMIIRKYHQSRGQGHRNVCLIPGSAHGTNPASAAMAGMNIVVVACDKSGNIELSDLKAKADQHRAELSCLMVTYPSTHGVFEEDIREICETVHSCGGQVYMDGANMNAQVGLCRPGEFGADLCHLNLHKTFAMPHGGGGPGLGPVAVAKHLAPFLPGHPEVRVGGEKAIGAVAAAPWGSPSLLPVSYIYMITMGPVGLKNATEAAILNANYVARKLDPHFPVLYKGAHGLVAHECIVDLRKLKDQTGIEVEDVAKRLMDYGFHAPTVSFPVAGTLMIEPTESEPLEELDRFCEAMIAIRAEIEEVAAGRADKNNNVLKNAPHTAEQIARDDWSRPYSREKAVYPLPWVRERKFWPYVSRIDNVYGDRNLKGVRQLFG